MGGVGITGSPSRLLSWADLLDRQQGQAEVADLGQQAVQGRLVGDRPGDQVWPGASLVTGRPSNQPDQ
jgi:hypothetical protein